MSLKAFHIVFIVAATLLALITAGWSLLAFARQAGWPYLVLGLLCLATAGGLVCYARYILKKLQRWSCL
jgi:hypothetical protein